MLQQITNNIALDSLIFKTLSTEAKPVKVLPGLDSLVDIEVLNFTKDVAKILLNGRVFQASLPIKVNSGEKFLAKVIGHNPLTLSLSNLINTKLSELNIINLVAERFGINITANFQKLVKAFIINNKPLVKTKLESFLNHIENSGENFTEEQFNEIVKIISDEDLKNDNLPILLKEHLKYLPEQISSEIYQLIRKLVSSGISLELKTILQDEFFIKADDTINNFINNLAAKNSSRIIKLMLFLKDEYDKTQNPDYIRLNRLLEDYLIKRYFLMKSNVNQNIKILQGFTSDYLLEYSIQPYPKDERIKPYKFELRLAEPESNRENKIRGLFTEVNLFLDFVLHNTLSDKANSNLNLLENDLKKSLKINTYFRVINESLTNENVQRENNSFNRRV